MELNFKEESTKKRKGGDVRQCFFLGYPVKSSITVIRLVSWIYAFWKALKLRKSAARSLSDEALEVFLCEEVFYKGGGALAPILFFTFEKVSCIIEQDSRDNGQCANTAAASFYLSCILSLLFLMSIVDKSVPARIEETSA